MSSFLISYEYYSIIQQLRQTDVWRSSTGSRPAAAKELHKSNMFRDNADGQIRSLPWQSLQDVVMDVRKVQQVRLSDPGDTLNRKAGQLVGN